MFLTWAVMTRIKITKKEAGRENRAVPVWSLCTSYARETAAGRARGGSHGGLNSREVWARHGTQESPVN